MHSVRSGEEQFSSPTYAGRAIEAPLPKNRLPSRGIGPRAAYQVIHDELSLDGNPTLNLASFVTTWMEPEAERLASELAGKNLIDQDEYPQTQELHRRVVSIVAHLFHAPAATDAVGTATIGSSEAILLAMLAHKRSWQLRRREAGLDVERPNMVIGADVHTCWEKFARYFEVEARVAPLEPGRYTISAEQVEPLLDERTIAVAGVVGTTFTGQLDDIASIASLLERVEEEPGWSIPLHVDAASGGFVLPFCAPELVWDFRLPAVRSINVSNHKFGLVYPGMGTVVFRSRADLPEELVFKISYLGGEMENYSLNFSRPSAQVVLQYFNFLHLGREGYNRIVKATLAAAQALAHRLQELDELELIGDGSLLPVVTAKARDPKQLDLTALSARLRERGWIVPAYRLPPNCTDLEVVRVVVKESFSLDMAELLARDLRWAISRCRNGADRRPTPRLRPHC